MRKEGEKIRGKISMVRWHRQKKIYDWQRNIGQVCEPRQLMSNQGREGTGKRFIVPI